MAKKHNHPCAIAATLNVIGDRWTMLLIREAFYGTTRFGDFLKNTGISRNLLTERLNQLIQDGIFVKQPFADRGTSHVYGLTDKGRALDAVFLAMSKWGNEHVYGAGKEPVRMIDGETGLPVAGLDLVNSEGQPVSRSKIKLELGPGGDGRTRNRLAAARKFPFS